MTDGHFLILSSRYLTTVMIPWKSQKMKHHHHNEGVKIQHDWMIRQEIKHSQEIGSVSLSTFQTFQWLTSMSIVVLSSTLWQPCLRKSVNFPFFHDTVVQKIKLDEILKTGVQLTFLKTLWYYLIWCQMLVMDRILLPGDQRWNLVQWTLEQTKIELFYGFRHFGRDVVKCSIRAQFYS